MGKPGKREDMAPDRLLALQRERDAARLRIGGATYQQIADTLGMSNEGARQCVRRSIDRLVDERDESAHDLRTMIIERDNAMLTKVYLRALTGHLESIRVVIAINKQFMRIFGLAAASKLDVNRTPHTPADIRALKAELVDLLRKEAEMEGASDG